MHSRLFKPFPSQFALMVEGFKGTQKSYYIAINLDSQISHSNSDLSRV
jgi:hypothetical protein